MNPLILETAEVKDDYEKVLEYIKKNPSDIVYASDRLRNDEKLAKLALEIDPLSYEFLGDKIKEMPDIAFSVYQENKLMYRHFPNALKNSEDFTLKVVNYDFGAIEVVLDHKWRENKKVMKLAIQKDVSYFRKATCDLSDETDFLVNLVKNSPEAYFFFPKKIKEDVGLKIAVFDFLEDDMKFTLLDGLTDEGVVNDFIKKVPSLYLSVNASFREKDISLFFIESSKSIEGVPAELFKDKDFWIETKKALSFNDEQDKEFLKSTKVKQLLKDSEIKQALKDAEKEIKQSLKKKNKLA